MLLGNFRNLKMIVNDVGFPLEGERYCAIIVIRAALD